LQSGEPGATVSTTLPSGARAVEVEAATRVGPEAGVETAALTARAAGEAAGARTALPEAWVGQDLTAPWES